MFECQLPLPGHYTLGVADGQAVPPTGFGPVTVKCINQAYALSQLEGIRELPCSTGGANRVPRGLIPSRFPVAE
jgi:hypothetical protein